MNWYKKSQSSGKFIAGPSGYCFSNVNRSPALHSDEAVAVHGMVTNMEGKSFLHAWIEDGNIVIDPTAGIITNREDYYKSVGATPKAKYSYLHVLRNMVRSKNHGPWTKDEVGDKFIWRDDA